MLVLTLRGRLGLLVHDRLRIAGGRRRRERSISLSYLCDDLFDYASTDHRTRLSDGVCCRFDSWVRLRLRQETGETVGKHLLDITSPYSI